MSFNVYVQFFQDGAAAGAPRHLIEDVFAPYVEESQSRLLQVRYGPNDWCMLSIDPLSDADDFVHFLTIERPCEDERLWLGVISMLRIGYGVLYFPGGKLLIADLSAAQHMPGEMLEALGAPGLVAAPRDILDYMKSV